MCFAWGGRGEEPVERCHECRGQGRVREISKIRLNIPAGISSGQNLRLDGQGEAGQFGGQAGDLFVNIYIRPHKHFERRGDDLYYDLVINFAKLKTHAILR